MASQIGDERYYTSVESENDSAANMVTCVKCKVKAVPRGITSTRTSAEGEKHCPNCGHVHGRDNH
jgi:transposase